MNAIFEYSCYRNFLSVWYENKKAEGEFSYDRFSALAGLKSRSFFKLVISGKRDLTSEGIFKTAKALGLSPNEHRYFELLVLENQADLPDQKKYFQNFMKAFKKESSSPSAKIKGSELLKYSFSLALLSLLSDAAPGISFETLHIKLKCSKAHLRELLEHLVDSKIIALTGDGYKMKSKFTILHDSKDWKRLQHEFLVKNLKRSLEAARSVASPVKMHSLVFTGDPSKITEYQAKMQEFLAQLSDDNPESHSNQTELFQFNAQLFPYHFE